MKSIFFVLGLVAGLLIVYWLNAPNGLTAKNEALEMSQIGSFVVVDKMVHGNNCRVVLADPVSDSRFVVSPEDQNLCLTLMPRDGVTVAFNNGVSYYGLTNRGVGYWLTITRFSP